jgi:hypothetical protein
MNNSPTKCLPLAFFLSLVLTGVCHVTAYEPPRERAAIIADFRSVSDEHLRDRVQKLLAGDRFWREIEYEPCLCEIIRRGGKNWRLFLERELNKLTARRFQPYQSAEEDQYYQGSTYNSELLTALRRVEKRPDPLKIVVDGPDPLVTKASALPRLKVAVQNVDSEKLRVGFRAGGDYRSGRQARWRLDLVEEKTRSPSVRWQPVGLGIFFGGGFCPETTLKPGGTWETVLEVRNYIAPLRPGRYRMEVLYHNTITIADEDDEDTSGLIVYRSAPMLLVVEPTIITLTEADRLLAARYVSALQPANAVKLVVGTYGPWAHRFISPDSPQGNLLQMGLKAAPRLIEVLQDKTISEAKRALILGILFTITGANNPTHENVLGNYEYVESGWQISGGVPSEPASGGVCLPSDEPNRIRGRIDPIAQQEMAKRWIQWLNDVHLQRVTAVPGK